MKKHQKSVPAVAVALSADEIATDATAEPARPNKWGLAIIVAVFGLGFMAGVLFKPKSGSQLPVTEGATLAKPGPWGNLELIPLTIAAPDEILPVKAMEANVTQWLFKGWSREQLLQFLATIDLDASAREQLVSPAALSVTPAGVLVKPSHEVILGLSEKARLQLYQKLCRNRENEAQFGLVHAASLEAFFRDSGVSSQTVALVKKLSCKFENHFIFSGWSTLLSAIPAYEEKARLIKALSRQKTLLAKLHVTRDSDTEALTRYWGKAVWNTDVKSILESLKQLPSGARVDIIELLPPFPSSLLYTFPVPQNPMNGPAVRRDCHWTSFNFFRDPPDARYGDSAFILQMLQTDHYPVQADPRFGDIVIFLRPDDAELVHTAVFLADNVVFTKNGETALHPWMFSTVSDLLDQYAFMASPGQKLEVRYYRNKYY